NVVHFLKPISAQSKIEGRGFISRQFESSFRRKVSGKMFQNCSGISYFCLCNRKRAKFPILSMGKEIPMEISRKIDSFLWEKTVVIAVVFQKSKGTVIIGAFKNRARQVATVGPNGFG